MDQEGTFASVLERHSSNRLITGYMACGLMKRLNVQPEDPEGLFSESLTFAHFLSFLPSAVGIKRCKFCATG
uniref:Uncharacterized protein n=1 Tax=Anguilla anguilla TaxID=7936 RepID=A0A0E9X911_ANGAN